MSGRPPRSGARRGVPWAIVVVAACAAVALAGERNREVATPRTASWAQVQRTHFRPKWRLPETRVDSRLPQGRRPRDLVADMRAFARRTFPPARGKTAPSYTLSVGNLLAALTRLDTDAQRRGLLGRLARERPDVHRAVGATLVQLVQSERLHDDWDPDEDSDDDGILTAEPVRRDVGESEHFRGLPENEDVHQAAVFVDADVATIKEVENDYSRYPDHVGAEYEHIHAVRGSYVRGKDDRGRPFAALRIDFECDLPFPYGSYECDLRILNEVGDDGLLRTHVYSPGDDFHWLAGQDLYVPVETTDGDAVGTLLVRLYGFDIDDVPDGDDARRAALRSSLGNLKRGAEALFEERGRTRTAVAGPLPPFPVRGLSPR